MSCGGGDGVCHSSPTARQGLGPSFLLCDTYRYHGHHVGDISRQYYRSKEEELHWVKERDPIALLSASLLDRQLVDRATLDAIAKEITAQMDAAVAFATAAPYPDPSEVNEDVYA